MVWFRQSCSAAGTASVAAAAGKRVRLSGSAAAQHRIGPVERRKNVLRCAASGAAFGVGQSTAYAKARVISDLLGTDRLDPTWMVPSLLAEHPITMIAELTGLLLALGDIEGEAREIPAVQGLLPYVPLK